MAPLGLVEIISSEPIPSVPPVGVWSYNAIYEGLGVTENIFKAWHAKYGFDSLGTGDQGENLIPGYPIFSKVAWMYVDPVDLSSEETNELVRECNRAISSVTDPDARAELAAIRDLAAEAVKRSATVRFGHP